MANCYERKPVLVATAEVPENLQLIKRNVKKYFEVKEVDSSLFIDDTVVSLNDVEGLYLQEMNCMFLWWKKAFPGRRGIRRWI